MVVSGSPSRPTSDGRRAERWLFPLGSAVTGSQSARWTGPSRRVLVRSVASPISGSSTWIDPPAADHNQSTFSGVLRGRRWYLLTRTPERPLDTRPYQFLPSVWTDS
jgi:hypothetical protein